MPVRFRFLLDTNIIIPLEDSMAALEPDLAEFIRLANLHGHILLYHPATELDIRRDDNEVRRIRTLQRLSMYQRLEDGPKNPWGTDPVLSPNAFCDDEILYAVDRAAAHALITEDQGLHAKARSHGLAGKVYYVQSALDWLRRLHERPAVALPNIQDIPLHNLVPRLADPFFASLRDGYAPFDDWFRRVAADGRRAWVYRPDHNRSPSAMCIYAVQENETINDEGERLPRTALKLCTFKVDELVRGRKIGELFLRAAFQHATANACENIFIHTKPTGQEPLIELLKDFGFEKRGIYLGDQVFVKLHPSVAPAVNLPPFDYCKRYYPHYRVDQDVRQFLVPIRPAYHRTLFPDFRVPGEAAAAVNPQSHVGNAMKLAYLSHAPSNQVRCGDLIVFYRGYDLMAATTLAIVEDTRTLTSATEIAQMVSRRTVYSESEIVKMARTPTKVMLFRLIEHFPTPVTYRRLLGDRIVSGPIQSILRINEQSFSRILRAGGR